MLLALLARVDIHGESVEIRVVASGAAFGPAGRKRFLEEKARYGRIRAHDQLEHPGALAAHGD